MKQLHQKIEARKHALDEKREHLHSNYESAKSRLSSKGGLSLTTIGGFVLGFLLLPKKFKIIRTVFKAYTMAATVRGFFDLLPQPKQKRTTSSKHHDYHRDHHSGH